jgi:hypothetical protein
MKLLEEYTEFNFNITKSNNNWINKSKLLEEDSNKQYLIIMKIIRIHF